ncbi:MAG: hypothetical protein KIT27_08495 [Legionellales bacterium]|nr:hypothetical protein [Legionellales bacterium]
MNVRNNLEDLLLDLSINMTHLTTYLKKVLDHHNIEFDEAFMGTFSDTVSKLHWARHHLALLKDLFIHLEVLKDLFFSSQKLN